MPPRAPGSRHGRPQLRSLERREHHRQSTQCRAHANLRMSQRRCRRPIRLPRAAMTAPRVQLAETTAPIEMPAHELLHDLQAECWSCRQLQTQLVMGMAAPGGRQPATTSLSSAHTTDPGQPAGQREARRTAQLHAAHHGALKQQRHCCWETVQPTRPRDAATMHPGASDGP